MTPPWNYRLQALGGLSAALLVTFLQAFWVNGIQR